MTDTSPPDVFTVANLLWETTALYQVLPDPQQVYADGPEALKDSAIAWVDDGGGSSANTLCALATHGLRTAIVGHIGDDDSGLCAKHSLERFGVFTLVSPLSGRRTKRSAIVKEINTDQGYFVVWLPPDSVPPPPDPPEQWLSQSPLLHLDRVSESSTRWAKQRFDRGLATSLDLHTCPYRLTATDRLRELLPYLTVLQLSWAAADALATRLGEPTPTALLLKLHRIIPWVVMTHGAQGALWADSDEVHHQPATRVNVVDSTGAGDAFVSTLLFSYLQRAPLPEAVAHAVQTGARATESLGPRAWMTRKDTVVDG